MNLSHLCIRNSGLAPIEAFTILGLSTARGEAEKIGQFGSGSKHGILTLMRAAVPFAIFIGEEQLTFYTQEATMGDKPYKEVRYRWKGEDHKTGMCLDFGALDWDTVRMSLREFICNALDQGEKIEDCAQAVETIATHPEETRVFVSLDHPEVRAYWEGLTEFFLHFDGQESMPILPARKKVTQFYRRGVYVTECGAESKPAMFLYNFQDGRIDESRNMDGAAVSAIAAKLLVESPNRVEEIFRSFGGMERWEHSIGSVLYWKCGADKKAAMLAAWKAVYGELPFAASDEIGNMLTRKRISFKAVPPSWTGFLDFIGATNGKALLTTMDQAGAVECEATPTAVATFMRVWSWIESVRLTQDKPFPKVMCFTMPMHEGNERMGFQRGDTVFINLDYDTNEQTAIEELAHYITGAEDETRDFQDFAFKLATRLAKLRTVAA